MAKHPSAFIFDLDGVITDTAEFHYLAWKQLADGLGVTIDREFNEQLKGISRMDSLEKIVALDPALGGLSADEKERLATEKNEHYIKLIAEVTPAHILPGMESLLKDIQAHGIKIALGSASKNAKMVLEQLELTDYFDYIVDAAQVSKGKPDPETFTTAADYFGFAYADCIGVEDAEAGVEALKRAGMFAVGVGLSLSEADYIVADTGTLHFDSVITHYNERSDS
ncbi:beta-phosphoglucomutase [Oceanobacillus bengalensis]|uniref:Beta-phosphoglucomutase n=1 Tax=Oceanobacillus bengalensis TaxID=1435466 RepID=A0A494YTP8_9BACI|nr:beta-phosphoglucomutase [Oceanobacillus bengalensis]RKQ13494.1 beta-phosphoglucomutase [Oceanobacillus bengalensis]